MAARAYILFRNTAGSFWQRRSRIIPPPIPVVIDINRHQKALSTYPKLIQRCMLVTENIPRPIASNMFTKLSMFSRLPKKRSVSL